MNSVDEKTGHLLAAVLTAKDKIAKQHREASNVYFDIYERLGRIVVLHLHAPKQAREEIVELCDLEFAITGSCDAIGAIADIIDPDGTTYRRMRDADD